MYKLKTFMIASSHSGAWASQGDVEANNGDGFVGIAFAKFAFLT